MQDDLKSITYPSIVPLTSRAQQYHNDMFSKMVESSKKLEITPISVFVCGPSANGHPVTQKKIDIINELRAREVTAILGEEEVGRLKAEDNRLGNCAKPDNAYELLIAEAADLIVVIRASPGSTAEAHEFLSHSGIETKTLICVDKAHSGGYSDAGAILLHRNLGYPVYDYSFPEDIDSCKLKSKVIEWVRSHQIAKGMKQKGFQVQ
ncbi:hypothetical protein ABFB09_02880 [Dehalogenimonas sp. THU2]|uniref:hypothetical protein n=1 Tax=Dehalogenimonas sp. THU2 TaxID=3151121 RepID=UPI0032186867